jgi:hypothetical protein
MEERLETGSGGAGRLALSRRTNSRQGFHAKFQQKRCVENTGAIKEHRYGSVDKVLNAVRKATTVEQLPWK